MIREGVILIAVIPGDDDLVAAPVVVAQLLFRNGEELPRRAPPTRYRFCQVEDFLATAPVLERLHIAGLGAAASPNARCCGALARTRFQDFGHPLPLPLFLLVS